MIIIIIIVIIIITTIIIILTAHKIERFTIIDYNRTPQHIYKEEIVYRCKSVRADNPYTLTPTYSIQSKIFNVIVNAWRIPNNFTSAGHGFVLP